MLSFLALQSVKPPSITILESTETVGCLHQWFIASPHGIAMVINKSLKISPHGGSDVHDDTIGKISGHQDTFASLWLYTIDGIVMGVYK